MTKQPKLTFGLIVLNGEPFIKYWLRSVYPWAHEIIVVEGATHHAVDSATADGHSLDGTLEAIRAFMATEDPVKKVTLVTAEIEDHPSGFWPGEKTQMCQAYAKRATGNFLVTFDVDEFLLDSDYPKVISVLKDGATHVCFNTINFWADIRYAVDGFWNIAHPQFFDRITAWGPGYRYTEHRPPTILDDRGIDVRTKSYVHADEMENKGIRLYHFLLLFPKQVINKSSYYARTGMYQLTAMDRWAKECYMQLRHPFWVHNVYKHMSWLMRYCGPIPHQILNLMNDVKEGRVLTETRRTDDVENLLSNGWYPLAARILRYWAIFIKSPVGKPVHRVLNSIYIRLPASLRIIDPPF